MSTTATGSIYQILPLSGDQVGTFTGLCNVAHDSLLLELGTAEAINLLDQAAQDRGKSRKQSELARFIADFGDDFPLFQGFWLVGLTPQEFTKRQSKVLHDCRSAILAAAAIEDISDVNDRCTALLEALHYMLEFFDSWKFYRAFTRWCELRRSEEDLALIKFLGSAGLPEWLTYDAQLAEVKQLLSMLE